VILLCVITDGRRDCIVNTIPSALKHLDGYISRKVIYDDSGDKEHRAWLAEQFADFEIVWAPNGRQGFGGAIRYLWLWLTANTDEPYVSHLEDDFTFRRRVDLRAQMDVLREHPNFVQIALRRQAWNAAEKAAGGVIEQDPHAYVEVCDGFNVWLEHRKFFTTNPSLYCRGLCERGWPDGPESEGRFTALRLEDPDVRFAYWGSRASDEWVTHIGTERHGSGY
jgi:hypothetical protein